MIFTSPYPDVDIPALTLTDFVLEHSARYGDKPALVDGPSGRTYTHAETADAIRAAAGALARDYIEGRGISEETARAYRLGLAPSQNARLANQLKALDTMLAALRDGLGPAWQQTTVLVATEFGRTAAVNGTGGTDHGQASVAMLAGGAVAGGRVIADWPGLHPSDLYEGRELKPTASLQALIAGAAADEEAKGGSAVAL